MLGNSHNSSVLYRIVPCTYEIKNKNVYFPRVNELLQITVSLTYLFIDLEDDLTFWIFNHFLNMQKDRPFYGHLQMEN